MSPTRLILSLVLLAALAAPGLAQDRASTGGAQTLEDILARQRGDVVDDAFRRSQTGDPNSAAAIANQLGALGGVSDPELWRAMRYGSADITVSSQSPGAELLVQDGGMRWIQWREGPLRTWGGNLLLITLIALTIFYLTRDRIRIAGGPSGEKIQRFKPVERFAHWLMAGSFILLGLTGLVSLFGRVALIPLFGHDAFAGIALASKWVHNNVSWAFMIGLIMVFFMWVLHNLPALHDITWLRKGGGLFSKHSHPPAKKFNAGQKIVFWSVIILGGSISVSGLSLLFPFEMPMFAKTFALMNDSGLTGLAGLEPLPTQLSIHEEMQYAQLWHSIVALVLMAIILAHIYIGSIGMEGAFDAMGSGEVDKQWAREHHSLWVDEVEAKAADEPAAPAE